MSTTHETVFVGLSGGVDSSVAALRLRNAGKEVVGVFIKTWQPDFVTCTWERERLDAMRVAAHLGIPFLTCDAEEAYKQDVAEYMIKEYANGRTPNPDVMCNRYVKFGAFLAFAKAHGADKIATGHYAQLEDQDGIPVLLRGNDPQKDQSYFLWSLNREQRAYTYFPVGNSTKSQIRSEAERAGLPTSKKQDSQGVCFLGEINMHDFLAHYLKPEKGTVVDMQGKIVGEHDGARFYTIGQRHGFTLATREHATKPRYIVAKDLVRNTLTVSEQAPLIVGANTITITDIETNALRIPEVCEAQFRYRQKPFRVKILAQTAETITLSVLDAFIDLPSVGQSCVFYNGNACLGGGILRDIE